MNVVTVGGVGETCEKLRLTFACLVIATAVAVALMLG